MEHLGKYNNLLCRGMHDSVYWVMELAVALINMRCIWISQRPEISTEPIFLHANKKWECLLDLLRQIHLFYPNKQLPIVPKPKHWNNSFNNTFKWSSHKRRPIYILNHLRSLTVFCIPPSPWLLTIGWFISQPRNGCDINCCFLFVCLFPFLFFK